jgi:hypothetical protein
MDFEEMVAIGLGLPANRLGDFAVEWEDEFFTVPAFVKANLQTAEVVDAIFEQPLDSPFTLQGAQPFVLRRIRGRLKTKQRRVRVGNEDVTLFKFLLDNQEDIEVIQNVLSLPLGQTLTWPVQAGLSLDITVYVGGEIGKKRRFSWAVYDGLRLVAQGEATTYAGVTRPSFDAAQKDAEGRYPNHGLFLDALSGYTISVWGPRGGNLEHQQPLRGKESRRRQRSGS